MTASHNERPEHWWIDVYRRMYLIRRCEEVISELVMSNEVPGVAHEYIGQEAVAVGICQALGEADVVTSTHRGHGHLLAKGAEPAGLFAELLGKREGLNAGRGGSMHVADFKVGLLGANGIVGASVPMAVGAAWASKQNGNAGVAVAFFGDGGLNQGVVLEAMNLAALWDIPVLFVCENNGYAVSLRIEDGMAGTVLARPSAFGIPAISVDGMDVGAVADAATDAVESMRRSSGPMFIETITYRFSGHHTAEKIGGISYRPSNEEDAWRLKDPLTVAMNKVDPRDAAEVQRQIEREVDEALKFARSCVDVTSDHALDFMYASGLRSKGTRG